MMVQALLVEQEDGPDLKAVVYSPGYGAGWASWNQVLGAEAGHVLLFDPDIVMAVIDGDTEKAKELAREKLSLKPGEYFCDDAEQLSVAWVEKDQPVTILQHDGWEVVAVVKDGKAYTITNDEGMLALKEKMEDGMGYKR